MEQEVYAYRRCLILTAKQQKSFDSGQRTSVLEKRIGRRDVHPETDINMATSEVIN